ncbi:aldehyde ferredoxin oxidoreductase family protein [Desulfovibrio sp. TomC]|uniref:aldehyde ferredoxin oxidoreductase family protein n=1 Tax=Desulfovibrio sp. TomC TaxID=1562888 RepID=UPI000575DF44|nr:aldehyde ferredoxin oxidoreductase family protein [Desulfovibrio sp. TomC]KHK04151.1 Tungsten-containing aldehyde:ferredoxin oxidoreductase [Desulfovibrio sp. TomC]
MHGFYGRILTVDLTRRTFAIEATDPAHLDAYLGGKGLATRLLLDRNPAGVDALAPENNLIFATGPLCGGVSWGASRYGVFTKSPQTGFYTESYAGGRTPQAVDAAGFDAVILTGAADSLTALTIHPDGCDFHDATALAGLDVYEADDLAKATFVLPRPDAKRVGVVVIGPAGENLCRLAMIANERWRCAGRTGVGAVMGSKRIKAIVFQGDRKREPADAKGLAAYAAAFAKRGAENKGVAAYKALGTTMMVGIMNAAGAFPAKYWTQGNCEHWEKISGERFHKEHEVKAHACAKCFMSCGRMAKLSSGRHQGMVLEGPEYETIYAFGGLCMIEDMAEIVYLNDLCDRLGIDTISAGNLCGFVIEAVKLGRVEYPISYNDPDGAARLIADIAAGTGIGALLGQGIKVAAKAWGLEDLAIHVKGLEPAGYDPRTLQGMGLAYATSDRGACHLRTTFYKPELAGMIPTDQVENKAALLIEFEDRLTIFDTLILCRFFRDLYTWEELSQVISLATGLDASEAALKRRAAAIADMTRTFNLREGLTPADDRLPARLHRESLPSGKHLPLESLETMLADYYRLRSWSPEGVPGLGAPGQPVL